MARARDQREKKQPRAGTVSPDARRRRTRRPAAPRGSASTPSPASPPQRQALADRGRGRGGGNRRSPRRGGLRRLGADQRKLLAVADQDGFAVGELVRLRPRRLAARHHPVRPEPPATDALP